MPDLSEELEQAQAVQPPAGPADDAQAYDAADEAPDEAQQPGDGQDQAGDAGQQLDDAEQEPVDEELEERRAHEAAFSWQASEFVHHHKGAAWYVGLAVLVLIPVAVLAFLHYWVEIGALVVGAVALLVYARKAPKALLYELTPEGIAIDGRTYPYSDFRSFSVVPDAAWHSIDLEPARRFRPPISVLFDTDDFDQIVGHLELHLPRDDRPLDLIDQISRALRF